MKILADVAQELFSMFVADLRLTLSTLGVIALVGALILWLKLGAALCGVILLAGCVLVLLEATAREARRRK
ncbi:MAG: hypothetical protein WAW96_15875 [Alphaproteobacteria bacterium]